MPSKKFFRANQIKDPEKVEIDDILDYQLELLEEHEYAPSTVNVNIAAIRTFFSCDHGQELGSRRHSPFVPKKNTKPVIMSHQEIATLLNAIPNLKHRTFMLTLYCGGLRTCEAVRLQACDIHSDRSMMHIRFGKNNKERYTLLPPVLLYALRYYWKAYPEDKTKCRFRGKTEIR